MRRKVYDQLKKWKEEQNGESAIKKQDLGLMDKLMS